LETYCCLSNALQHILAVFGAPVALEDHAVHPSRSLL